jgi:gliding motility-associated-like protein
MVTIFNDCSFDRKLFKVTFKLCPCGLHMPNAFTPNSDGLNDVFKPVFECSPKEYQLKIYDRYGSIVFESNQSNEGWNGKKRQNELPVGIYMWMIKYQHPGTKEMIRKTGIVTLLR